MGTEQENKKEQPSNFITKNSTENKDNNGVEDKLKGYVDLLQSFLNRSEETKANRNDSKKSSLDKPRLNKLLIYIIAFLIFLSGMTLFFIFRFEKFDGKKVNTISTQTFKLENSKDTSMCFCIGIKPGYPCEKDSVSITLTKKDNKKSSKEPLKIELENSTRVRLSGENAFIVLITFFYLTVIALIVAFVLKNKFDSQSEKDRIENDFKILQESTNRSEFEANHIFEVQKYLNQYGIDKQKADIVNVHERLANENERLSNLMEQQHKRIKNKHDEEQLKLDLELKKSKNPIELENTKSEWEFNQQKLKGEIDIAKNKLENILKEHDINMKIKKENWGLEQQKLKGEIDIAQNKLENILKEHDNNLKINKEDWSLALQKDEKAIELYKIHLEIEKATVLLNKIAEIKKNNESNDFQKTIDSLEKLIEQLTNSIKDRFNNSTNVSN